MSKDRFVAFFDAVMAIIMTIVVLEFAIPNGTNWSDLGIFVYQILAYAVSFFWLGGMWINIHELWHDIGVVDGGVLWANIAMLFFSSMIPFFVVYLGRNINATVPELLYGLDVLAVTLLNVLSVELLGRHHDCLKAKLPSYRLTFAVDIFIKVVGIFVGVTVFPLSILISVFAAMFAMAIMKLIFKSNKKDKGRQGD